MNLTFSDISPEVVCQGSHLTLQIEISQNIKRHSPTQPCEPFSSTTIAHLHDDVKHTLHSGSCS